MYKKIMILGTSLFAINSSYARLMDSACSTFIGGQCKSAKSAYNVCLKTKYPEQYKKIEEKFLSGGDIYIRIVNNKIFEFGTAKGESFPISDAKCLSKLKGSSLEEFFDETDKVTRHKAIIKAEKEFEQWEKNEEKKAENAQKQKYINWFMTQKKWALNSAINKFNTTTGKVIDKISHGSKKVPSVFNAEIYAILNPESVENAAIGRANKSRTAQLEAHFMETGYPTNDFLPQSSQDFEKILENKSATYALEEIYRNLMEGYEVDFSYWKSDKHIKTMWDDTDLETIKYNVQRLNDLYR